MTREFPAEVNRVIDAIAADYYFIAKKSHAYDVVVANALAHGAINSQRQTHAILARSAIAVDSIVQCAQETGHRVCVGVM